MGREKREGSKPMKTSPNRLKIHTDRPLPLRIVSKYPFDEMEIGDSFDLPLDEVTPGVKSGVYNAAHAAGVRATCRRIPTEGVFRVWRRK
jgi:hypothetical protein